ncbi:gag/pol protein [Cucumis melo var. makuwa]|uniref:Gag/pol protein n=1 Tax=Cucumis melo var. makuwa TaxID=1194695 RepID=A0A5D3BWP2_CUCMM|nr:gag/pol protein [Cucumis melo var. makuwa]TYK04131.1 gag/pol protein [Cucumis melo var. makuwa]
MNSSIVQLLASKKLNGDNCATWKSNLNTILMVDDLRFVLTEECPQPPVSNANQASQKAYDRWIKENKKARVYILASMSDVLAKKHESLDTAKEIMDSLKGMFGQPEWSLRHEAIKYIYTKCMKEGTSVREHVLDMMMHFNIAEVNDGAIDEANQRFQNLTKGKQKEVEANVATTKRKFKRGSSSKSKAGPSKPIRKIEKNGKGKTPKQNKEKKTTEKGKCYYCGENGHWIGRLVKSGLLSQLEDNSLPPCDSCLEGKMTKRSFTGKGIRVKTPLELVHFDICEPMNVKARRGYEYFISLLMIIRGKTIKTFRLDRGGEYMDLQFQYYLIEHGIQSQLSAPNTPQQNDRPSSSTKVVDKARNIGQTHPSQELGEPRRSGRVVRQPDRYLGLSEAQIIIPDDGIEDPLTYKKAMNDVD